MNETITSFNFTVPKQGISTVQYVTRQEHLFGFGEIFFIGAIFVLLAYWYVQVSKDKVKYEAWTNPKGRVINLYKIVRRIFWAYVVTVIILGGITILTAPK